MWIANVYFNLKPVNSNNYVLPVRNLKGILWISAATPDHHFLSFFFQKKGLEEPCVFYLITL